jgi:catechol 2,3-dioxygenase-like lactoylglutathione lyase family enzyme
MNQPSLKLSQVSNIMLGVRDLALSLAFYRDTLGLSVQQQIPGFAFLGGGGVTLALSEPLAKALPQTGSSVVIVFSVDDVRAAHEELAARKVHFTQEPRNVTGSLWAANFDDPDGHHLSIFGPERKA